MAENSVRAFKCLNPIQTGLFSTFWDRGYFKTAYAMATKLAKDSVHANTNPHIYCDATVT